MKTYALMLSVSALAITWAGSAWAQTTSDEDTQTLETVTVTAQRRNENLMKSAISATVITGTELTAKNIVKIEDLQFVAPQVTVDMFGQGINFNIRGIGKGEHNSATATGVITYRDGTPTFPGYMTEEPYYDIKSIEVLRGPQGTFVGQNATGGAVFVTTNDPDINGGYDGYVMANAGNYGEAGAQGAVNIPISNTFAMRVAGFFDRRDPFYEITNNDTATNHGNTDYKNDSSALYGAMRISLLWKPIEQLSVSFKTDWDYLDNGPFAGGVYTHMCKYVVPENGGGPYVYTGSPNVGCAKQGDPGAVDNSAQYTGDPLKFNANGPNRFLDKFTRNTLKIEYAFPDGTLLRSVSSWAKGNTMYETDLDGTDTGTWLSASRARNYLWYDSVGESMATQEINLISPSDQRITWILGAFAQSDEYIFVGPWKLAPDWPAGTDPYVDPLDGIAPSHLTGKTSTTYEMQGHNPKSSWAVFGQIGAKLFSGLEAKVGWRWTTQHQKNKFDIWYLGSFMHQDQKTKSYSFDYKAALEWTINDNNFVYGFVSTGYKPGGLNTPVPGVSTTPEFGPERVLSYETGYKGVWLDGHVRTQVDAYYYAYDHFQVTMGNPAVPYFNLEINSENATIMYGFEAEMEAVFGNFATSLGIGWLHSELGDFWSDDTRGKVYYYGWGALPCDPAKGPQYPSWWATYAALGGTNKTCFNLKGHPQTYAPSLTGSINVEYRFELGEGNTLTPRLSYSHQGVQWATLFDNERLGDKLGVRNLLGAQLELKYKDYIVTLYGTNLTDMHYVSAMESNLVFGGPPRQFGVRLMRAF